MTKNQPNREVEKGHCAVLWPLYNKTMNFYNRIHSKWRWSHFLNKILIVDANEFDCVEMSCVLNQNGYTHISVATNPKEALSIAKEQNPDLILINVDLEAIDGFELTKQILSLENNHSKVVHIANDVRHINLAKSKSSGAIDLLVKTRNFDYLSRTVHDLIES